MCAFSESMSKVLPDNLAMEMKFSLSVAVGDNVGSLRLQMTQAGGCPVDPGKRVKCSLNVSAHSSHLWSPVNDLGFMVILLSEASSRNWSCSSD